MALQAKKNPQLLVLALLCIFTAMSCEYPDYFNPPQDDNYEDNDILAQAFDLSSHTNIYLSEIQGKAIHLDADWYCFTIESTGNLRISCLFNFDYDNDLDLALYYNGSILANSEDNTSDEIMETSLPEAGIYYIHVYNGIDGDKGQGTIYDLKWEIL
ncbi:MAG: PPC domain-containing protein [Spirochaetales bacterium]|nr:PPC domain-containing protein [Spirochaetales bacterium]